MGTVLDKLRVIDVSEGPIGGITTTVLADFGAEVIKVERPTGDPWRNLPNSPIWLRGKQSISLDLQTNDGKQELLKLIETADIFICNERPETVKKMGLSYNDLAANNPELIYCSITGFGNTGEYANYSDYEGVVAAKSGRMLRFAEIADRDGPGYPAVQVGSHACSQLAISGILAALHAREETGTGQLVETSILQGLMLYDLVALLRTQLERRFPEEFAADPHYARLNSGMLPTLNYHPVQTKDGYWIQMGNLLAHLFDNFIAAIGLTDIYSDPRYAGLQGEWTNEAREELRDKILLRMQEKTRAEWMEIFIDHGGIAATPYTSTQEALDNPDIIANNHVLEKTHPKLGSIKEIGLLAKLTKTPGLVGQKEPAIGEHNEEIQKEIKEKRLRKNKVIEQQKRNGPLQGLTIIELATVIAAPLGAAILADLGARVIKVELIGGDPFRRMGLGGLGAGRVNAGKESISIDLKSSEGQKILHKLIEKTDILIHNYRPGVPERLGIGYEELSKIQPQLVYVSVNGYGPDGPGAHRPSTHPIPGAGIGGAVWQMGNGRPKPCATLEEIKDMSRRLFRANELNPDPNTSAVVATAALLGITARNRKNVGQQIFVDMFGANAWANSDDFISYPGKPKRPNVDENLYGLGATYRLYRTSKGWVFLAIIQDSEWKRFCELTASKNLLANKKFLTQENRKLNENELVQILEALFLERKASEWEKLLATEGIGCVEADNQTEGEFWTDNKHVQENNLIVEVKGQNYGEHFRHNDPIQFSGGNAAKTSTPLAGEQTKTILSELGYSQKDIASLITNEAVWIEEPNPFS